MSSINIIMKLDTTDPDRKIAEIDRKTNEFVKKFAKAQEETERGLMRTMRGAQKVMSLISQSLSAWGITLDPLANALMAAIGASITSVLAIHRVMEAGTGGAAAAFTVGWSIAAIAAAGAGTVMVAAGMNEVKATSDRIQAIADNFAGWGYWAGGF